MANLRRQLNTSTAQYLRVMIDKHCGGPTELVENVAYRWSSHRRKGTILLDTYGLAISLAYPSGEEGGILLVQMISDFTASSDIIKI
jgi:hypothetical protein